MMRAILIGVSGLAAGTAGGGEGVALHFSAAQATAFRGDTIDWTVSASFTGFPDPTAYFVGFLGSFVASHEYGELVSFRNLMSRSWNMPTGDGADVTGINITNSALFGTDDPSNPLEIFEFTMLVTTDEPILGGVGYAAEGTAYVSLTGHPLSLVSDFTGFPSQSDLVGINVPAPGSVLVIGCAWVAAGRRRR